MELSAIPYPIQTIHPLNKRLFGKFRIA